MQSEWLQAFIGGLILGSAGILLLLANGRIFGVSGILGGVLIPKKGDVSWRVALLLGLIIGGFILRVIYPAAFDLVPNRSVAYTVIGGLLVGFGTRMGQGCTSGHGICGISRFSARSMAATVAFLVSGMLAATLIGFWR